MGEHDPAGKDDSARQNPTPAQIIRYVAEETAMNSDDPPFEIAVERYPPEPKDILIKSGAVKQVQS